MDSELQQAILEGSKKHPRPQNIVYQYGTAGFRLKANLLDSVVYRVGLLAALRSRKMNGQTIGVMITASHNPPEDNGVKLVDPMGEMLEASWETYATQLANAETDEALVQIYEKIANLVKVKSDMKSSVVFARDTRASGKTLATALTDGLTATNTEFIDYKIMTTPELHYITRCTNTKGTQEEYGDVSEIGYYEKLSKAFKQLMYGRKVNGSVTVDCANGVGGPKLRELIKYLSTAAEGGIDINVINDDVISPERLNFQCGADFVKTQQRLPPATQAVPLARYASLDGDADRIVYYFIDNDNTFKLLDGDKIATLVASFIVDLAKQAGISDDLRVGVVQTAYANGASTDYLTKSLKLPVVCTPTGVKHLHHAAVRFDVGVYFEANGHGTVLFSNQTIKMLRRHEPQSPGQKYALDNLVALTELINQTVGDALSDLLLVEVVLAHKGWGPKEWNNTYTDLPNRLRRIVVPDRNIFKTEDAERRLVEPKGMQILIDDIVGKYKLGRSFVRASGTEDAVRLYAEAASHAEADELANKISAIIQRPK